MDEKEYRSAYQTLNHTRCVYEKAINSRVCNCALARRFNLADREGVACRSPQAQQMCTQLLEKLRQKARFLIQQTSVEEPLPHNTEIKIQNGGIKGLVKTVEPADYDEQDIHHVLNLAIKKYSTIDQLPYGLIMQEISAYKGRRRSRKR